MPPRHVSPLVDMTLKTLLHISRMVTSNVPPPRSNTAMFKSFFSLSRPYARDAAVGSLIMRTMSSPAITPASLVAVLWLSLKYAGTVTTAFFIFFPRNASASFFIFLSIIAEISCGIYVLPLIFIL